MEQISKNRERNNILKAGSKNLNTENWKVYHPNGHHMFTCGERKVQWYLDRDLAIKIGKRKIKFLFEPKGNGFEDNEEFGRAVRETRCVVSGVVDGLQRHHIVPYCYRTYFPEEFKSKNHHDVVLLHHKTHTDYEKEANLFKVEISRIYGVKSIKELNSEYTALIRDFGSVKGILLNELHSIFKSYGKIPRERILEKLKFISEQTEIPYETMKTYNYIQLYKLFILLRKVHYKELREFKKENRGKYDHGYHVVKKLDTEEKLREFIVLWRQHFIDTTNPQYMPDGWSVNFRIKTKIK